MKMIDALPLQVGRLSFGKEREKKYWQGWKSNVIILHDTIYDMKGYIGGRNDKTTKKAERLK